mmetsp:Transcript_31940/g.52718  ORF Transcript_31940/g.52718 Transcript_31940/m.52718 type:complete len:644 (-) Transcript_31940:164-2095(-)|eukprot:CAMPEP_0119015112 /NCGR_PEP_ID=MMETSP1176-20130426/10564_1 /TAXON_ID=265551 /ORGANISM="Synedropsis recta cf, Strain CCMP1620" /LENGTH=643 /DNA_ID=CAMNT_0006968381 /DNA_START=33 /DNA_END=1964 /DNA_ORIENTATION=+
MSNTLNWRTERRTKAALANGGQYSTDDISALTPSSGHVHTRLRPDAAAAAAADVHSEESSDEEIDDDLPGAYAVTRGPSERTIGWDPTDQISTTSYVPPMLEQFEDERNSSMGDSSRSSDRRSNDDTQAASSRDPTLPSQDFGEVVVSVMQIPLETVKKSSSRKRWMWLAILVTVLGIGIVGSAIAMLLSSGYKSEVQGLPASGAVSYDECKTSADLIVNCECFRRAVSTDGPVYDSYLYLKGELADRLGIEAQADSCSPENLALAWAAMDSTTAAGDGENLPIERTQNRFILVLLYISWAGQNWQHRNNWLSDESECLWHGVICDEQEQPNITSLSLRQNHVTGSLESRLGLLRDLKKLDLALNVLSGSIPTELLNLPNLEELILEDTDITGPIPLNLAEASTLKLLDISSTSVTGTLPSLPGLQNLRTLMFESTFLSGTIPHDWGSLRQLERLSLRGVVDITGTLPSSFGWLTNLVNLDVLGTHLTGTIPEFIGSMISLEFLNLGSTFMTGTVPTELGYLTSIGTLRIDNLGLVGSIPSEIGRCTKLVDFKIENNSFTGTLPSELGSLLELESFMASRCFNLVGTVPVAMGKLEKLEVLELFNTGITGTIPSAICGHSAIQTVVMTDIACDCCVTFDNTNG